MDPGLAAPLVRAFLTSVLSTSSSELDACFLDYLVAALSQDDVDLEDLDEMLAAVHPAFGAMQPDARLGMLLDVYHQVKDLHARAPLEGSIGAPEDVRTQQQAQAQQQQQQQGAGHPLQPSTLAEAEAEAALSSVPEALVDERVDQLLEFCPVDVSRAFISHVLRLKGNLQSAAEFMLECQDLKERECEFVRQEEAQRRRQQEEEVLAERSRRSIIARFALQEVKEPAHGKKGSEQNPLLLPAALEKEAPKVRYLNGVAVHVRKGEKYVETGSKEEWDGGSRGKVKTKGKRGKGFA